MRSDSARPAPTVRITASRCTPAAPRKRWSSITNPIAPRAAGVSAPARAHHLALDIGSDEATRGAEEPLRGARLHRLLGDQDRNYFHSIYVRSPGGILTECAASVPEGVSRKDEPIDRLGMELLLPPWFEERRAEIVAHARADHRAGSEPSGRGGS